jgi:hypothetical protein
MSKLPFICALVCAAAACSHPEMKTARIDADVGRVLHTLRGGLGASWHAISRDFPLDNHLYRYPAREENSRGSAWGGNPPVSDTAAWRQVKDHATWLGMNFIRVELSQRMYEPARGQFDWENEEMQALYNILDWCQQHGADVFLQQMWGYVDWNSYEGVHPLISAPKDPDDFVRGIATLLEYLTGERGYTCIKYFCMTNEPPGGTWGYWWEYGGNPGSIDDAWKRLREELDARNIAVKLSGPDWTDMPPFDEEKLGFAGWLDAIDIHSYQGVTPDGEANLRRWADWAHAQGKPFFLTEFGNMRLGWGKDNPGPSTMEAALSNASDLIRGLRAGVDAFNRWSFTNRGDLDGQWQLVRTWDRANNQYLPQVGPEPEAYFGFGILSRFWSKYSRSLDVHCSLPDSLLMAGALLSPQGEVSLFIVNHSSGPVEARVALNGIKSAELHLYQVSRERIADPGFRLEPVASMPSGAPATVVLPARSISTLSSYRLGAGDAGVVER